MIPKERPILFSAPMVRAILRSENPKTQTRRVIKSQPSAESVMHANYAHGSRKAEALHCPFGTIGDRLWVRETWQDGDVALDEPRGVVYRATDPGWETTPEWRWRPSIHMPRWASRITLEITDIRFERVQAISAKDILAEGAVDRPHYDKYVGKMPVSTFDGKAYVDLKSLWAAAWEQINGKGSWAKNEWVAVITFKRV